jgi:Flp pilus assembly protein protease CpaA
MISAHTLSANRRTSPTATMSKKTLWTVALLFPAVVGPVWCLAWHGYGGRVGTLSGLILLSLIITSAITDFNRHRIFNWATYSAFLWALAINLVALVTTYGSEPTRPSLAPAGIVGPPVLGGVGIGECLGGAGLCFMVVLFGYDLSGGGAGDVKLAAAIGALIGLHDGIFAVAYTYVFAALAIIAWSTWRNGPLALVKAAVRAIGRLLGPLWPFPSTSDDQALLMKPVPLGPFFAIGTLLVLLGIVPT